MNTFFSFLHFLIVLKITIIVTVLVFIEESCKMSIISDEDLRAILAGFEVEVRYAFSIYDSIAKYSESSIQKLAGS